MVSEPWEFDQARALFEAQRAWIAARGKRGPTAIRYGAMLEVPALAEMLDILLPKIDFLSIGTNDLTQFLFAADRANPKLAERYDWLSPAGREHDVPVAVCGEMGGRPLEAMALLGLGIERLSITPAAVGPVKAMVRSLDLGALRAEMPAFLRAPPSNMRTALAGWANDHAVEIA